MRKRNLTYRSGLVASKPHAPNLPKRRLLLRQSKDVIAVQSEFGFATMRQSIPSIHPINREFLQHDYPTDVISFPYELEPPMVEGELVASFETAIENASEPSNPLSPREELLLYVVHGTLHIVGHDDQSPEPRAAMRRAEIAAMKLIGIELPLSNDEDSAPEQDDSFDDDASDSSGGIMSGGVS